MNDIDQTEQPTATTGNTHDVITHKSSSRQFQRQRTSASPEPRTNTTGLTTNSAVAIPGAGNSSSLPGHQSGRSQHVNHHHLDLQVLNSTDNLHSSHIDGDQDFNATNHSPSLSLLRKKNLSTSDLDPLERRKQAALTKVEGKLEKAQRLLKKAQQSVEEEISDFLRVTTLPHTNPEVNSARITNATFEKRIRTLQDTKKELEKKITTYQSDISRIQTGDIPHTYTSSKDIFSNIKSTAVKVASGSLKHRSTPANDTISTSHINEQISSVHHPESDHHHPTLTLTLPVATNNNQNQYSNILEAAHSSLSSSISNEIGNSQFYIDSSYEHVFDGDKSSRKYDANIPADGLTIHDADRSPTSNRHLTEDSNFESNDRISDLSNDDRHANTTTISKRNTSITTANEYHQLTMKIDNMQKLLDRYEAKSNDLQKKLDILTLNNEIQREQNERLNNELTDLTDLHQTEISSIKTDLKNLEERLLYKFNDYWNELLEKLDKLDTRTAKVEQTQTHSLETEENTHRIISKLVNILLTVFAIILLLLSTIKNLVQSRVHALTLLILALIWITFHYLPPNYFQTSVFKNFPNIFKRAS